MLERVPTTFTDCKDCNVTVILKIDVFSYRN